MELQPEFGAGKGVAHARVPPMGVGNFLTNAEPQASAWVAVAGAFPETLKQARLVGITCLEVRYLVAQRVVR
ncbi:hypothetical protein LPB72_04980 [Hydrogenophaga crassostreae]|uniref:Uncharacterized protein n=1 Tax=Hydrogenophaga crassostreae TaxID=1763535 RepID=A0ABX2U9L6_9BURK|nr:hypothetical protein [Hydrogenophaga crassostreae]OAD43206.1 hypothetical protein LPB72_04980 [Hydrogenophaga crassostreae]